MNKHQEAVKLAIKRQTEINTASPKAAMEALVRMEILDVNGNLTCEFMNAIEKEINDE